MSDKLHYVVAGDTVDKLSKMYGSSIENIISWNNLDSNNPILYAGNSVYVYRDYNAEQYSTPESWNAAIITKFGLVQGTTRKIYACWRFGKGDIDHYEVYWRYSIGNQMGIDAGKQDVKETNATTFDVPEEAIYVACEVLPISKTKTENDKEVPYWTAQRSSTARYYFKDNPPEVPENLKVELNDLTLSGHIDNISLNATHIQFQVYANDSYVYNTVDAQISNMYASFSCAVSPGNRYKVRCRGIRDGIYGAWTEFTDNYKTKPEASAGITVIRAGDKDSTSVYLEWAPVADATKYAIEYTLNKDYFDSSNQVSSVEATLNHFIVTGIDPGYEYFFRVRAINDNGSSSWCAPKSITIGSDPAPPTTWSSTTTAIVGEPLKLYWVHNSQDGSKQTFADLETVIGSTTHSELIEIQNGSDDSTISEYSIDTSAYPEGTKIYWRVRTAGITKNFGEFSVQRVVDIYAKPTLELRITNINGQQLNTINSFPFYVKGFAGPNTQSPIGYHLSIVSKQTYETVDNLGNKVTVSSGDELYSKYFDTSDQLLVEFSAGNINLERNIQYSVICVVSMNSGLTATSSVDFTVSWEDMKYWPNAEVNIDSTTYAAYINPNCYEYSINSYKVNKDGDSYTLTDETINPPDELTSTGKHTVTGEEVYVAQPSVGDAIYYSMVESKNLVSEDIELSVYRREFDGTFKEIATGINNRNHTFVTDPHPSLDFARYRIVATVVSTGAVSYYDMPGIPVGEKAVIIQWDEKWTNFNSIGAEKLEEPPWSGSLLRLPYNIDVSDKHNPDVDLVEYIGRTHPVSYYGTQTGESQSWSVDIDKSDKDTLYAIRRLARWMGDVYVREPSGSGYWANVTVSFSQNHCELTIPVSFDITRVEGGI